MYYFTIYVLNFMDNRKSMGVLNVGEGIILKKEACGMNSSVSRSSKHGNVFTGSVQAGEFLDQLN